jgi:hypothetical protein
LTITKQVWFDTTRILFGEIVHLAFKHNKVIGFQSWRSVGIYYIELTFDSGAAVVLEYDSKSKWESVVKIIGDSMSSEPS